MAKFKALMAEEAPNAGEIVTYGILGWRGKRINVVVSPTKKDITFAFSRGAEVEDKPGLLQGVGHVSKHVKIKNIATANKDALRYYINPALKLDSEQA
jgi:hypothetical protein